LRSASTDSLEARLPLQRRSGNASLESALGRFLTLAVGPEEVGFPAGPMPKRVAKADPQNGPHGGLGSVWVRGTLERDFASNHLTNRAFRSGYTCFRNDGVACSSHASGTTPSKRCLNLNLGNARQHGSDDWGRFGALHEQICAICEKHERQWKTDITLSGRGIGPARVSMKMVSNGQARSGSSSPWSSPSSPWSSPSSPWSSPSSPWSSPSSP
jgi:hypothetical protein